MWHAILSQVNRVDSWLFLVGSQTGSSTLGLSFGHNLCFGCLNEQCEPILDIYAPRAFQWYKKRHKPLRLDPSNWSLKFWEFVGTPSPKVGVALGVWRLTPSHSPTLPGVPNVTPGLPLGPHPCNPFCLGRELKVRVATIHAPPHLMFHSVCSSIHYTHHPCRHYGVSVLAVEISLTQFHINNKITYKTLPRLRKFYELVQPLKQGHFQYHGLIFR